MQLDHPLLHLHDALLVSPDASLHASLPELPALAPWCRVTDDGRRILVEHGGTVVTFEGRAAASLLPALLPILDGTRTVPQLEAVLGTPAAPAVRNALEQLAANRLLVDGPHRPPAADLVTAAASFAAAVTRHTTQADALEALARASVAVLGTSATADELQTHLARIGVGRVECLPLGAEPEPGWFVVAAPDPDELAGLERLNELMLERRAPWLQALPFDGRVLVVGPVFLPGASACRMCFVLRRAACSGYETDFELVERTTARATAPAPVTGFAASLAALLTLRWLTTCDPALPGRLYVVEPGAVVRLSYDCVLRVPRCGVCGAPERATASPWFEAAA